MKSKSKSKIIEVIVNTKDIELLTHIGMRLPPLQNLIYKKILILTKVKR